MNPSLLEAMAYALQLDTADLQEPSEALAAKTAHLKEKLAKLGERAAAVEGDREGDARLA